jgi:hypothetical protein
MSTEKKLTAVEWLQEQIIKFHNWKLNPIYDENCFDEIELDKAINQAKEKEKQQICKAYFCGYDENLTRSGEQYYKEMFKNE